MTLITESLAEKLMSIVPVGEIKDALVSEYRHRIIRYRMTDEMMKNKYGMAFKEFEARNVVREQNYAWHVESDAMEWEHAIEGLRYVNEKLTALQRQ